MTYATYLQTAHWRSVRNRALKRAGFKCVRCSVGRDLQVHHLTYERIGCELDSDLEVLCRGCHLGLHVHEVTHGLGVYLRIIREALKSDTFVNLSDLTEEVKQRCARARLSYTDGQIQAAIAMVNREDRLTFKAPMPKKYAELLDAGAGYQPFTKAEAAGILARLGAQGLMKPMATVKMTTQREVDKRLAVRQLAALVLDQIRVCEEAEAALDLALKRL